MAASGHLRCPFTCHQEHSFLLTPQRRIQPSFFFFFIIVPKYTYGLLYQSLKFLSLREGVYAIYFLLYNCRQEAKKKPLWACGQASLCPSSPYSWEDREGCLGEGGCFAMDFPKDGRKTSPLLCESPPAYGCTQKADRPVVLMRGLPG